MSDMHRAVSAAFVGPRRARAVGSTPKEALKQLALGVAFRWLGLCYFYSSPACQQAPGTNKQCCVMGGCQDVDVGCWDFCGDL